MTETATTTSPRATTQHSHSHTRQANRRSTTTHVARQSGSIAQTMPPFLSTPHRQQPTPSANVKTPSPNYFGFQGEDISFLTDSPQHAKGNWSPPSSAVRSTAAASPSVLPLDQNPEFDAFRRQSEGKAFNLGGMTSNIRMNIPAGKTSAARPEAQRRVSSHLKAEQLKEAAQTAHRKSLDPSTAEYGRSPKRVLSPGSMVLPEEARRASPASFAKGEHEGHGRNAVTLDSSPRFALPLDSVPGSKARAETLPASGDLEGQLMVTAQHVVSLLDAKPEQVLLLDLRVQTQYAKAHVMGALNLCIPTTLLKRPSFNVQKLADAFKDDEQRHKFEQWRSSSYIIVYDGSSQLLKDATICVNTIKKFKSEGYEGTLYILKGGFSDFSRRFPGYVETAFDSDASDSSTTGVHSDGPDAIPVMGGCPMPSTDKPANPFFGNIRQNMDLIGGVGQIPLKHPSKTSKSAEKDFPEWLRQASEDRDQGKSVSRKFEAIEQREKKRMEDALSGNVTFDNSTPRHQKPTNFHRNPSSVQIAGIEKGNKNRYNNIWPFEHSRVKLQNVPREGCDYFNASFVKAAYSNRSYISTQAPIPATFNDFWNVVWQQDVRVIVMLTAEREGAQVKAHCYWGEREYGSLRLETLGERKVSIEPSRIHRRAKEGRPGILKRGSTHGSVRGEDEKAKSGEEEPYVIVRRFTLSHSRYPFEPMREIVQLQYAAWPDFGAPAHPAHLLGLVEQCDLVVRSTLNGSGSKGKDGRKGSGSARGAMEPVAMGERPILVHCSAGCGRTGTFCTVDSVVDMLKRQRLHDKEEREKKDGKMDIDKPASSAQSSQQKNASDFFTSTTTAKQESLSSEDSGPEGSWVNRDDVDLIERTVEDFRHQRLSMVQSLRQFVLCYESVMEWIVEQHGSPSSSSERG